MNRKRPYLRLLVFIVFIAIPVSGQQKTGLIMWGSEKQCKSATTGLTALCDFIVVDDLGYRVLSSDGRLIAVTFAVDGDYLLADVLISNEGKDRFLIEPSKWGVFGYKDEASSLAGAKPLVQSYAENPAKIADKIERKARWAAFFTNLSAAFATQTSEIEGQIRDTSGNLATYSGTITSPDSVAKRNAAAANNDRQARATAKADSILDLALRANTIFPDSRVAGRVFFKKGKARFYEVYIPIGDVIYLFTVNRKK